MPQDHSFDIVCTVDLQEVRNAVQMALKEAGQRYDFKGSVVEITLDETGQTLALLAGDDSKLKALADILLGRLIKRGISPKALTFGTPETRSGDQQAQTITLQQGIPPEKGRELVKAIKALRLKVQPGIHDDKVKVTAPKIDDLQTVMGALRARDFGIAMSFENYR